MQAKFLTAALIAIAGFAAAPSFAGQYLGGEVGAFAPDAQSTSTLSRAEVRNATIQAARAGTLPATGEGADLGQVQTAQAGDTTRAEVQASAQRFVRNGGTIGNKY